MNQLSILPVLALAFPLIGAMAVQWIDKTFSGLADQFTAMATLASA